MNKPKRSVVRDSRIGGSFYLCLCPFINGKINVDAETGEVVDLYDHLYNDGPWGDSSLPPKMKMVSI